MSWITDSPLHAVWNAMKARCYNSRNSSYPRYGALGIRVCDRWLDKTRVKVGEYKGPNGQILPIRWPLGYLNFLTDMGERPTGSSLDRIDGSGDYEPSNCRWATIHQQNSHKRNNNDVVGVSFDKYGKMWEGYLVVDGTRVFRKRSKDRDVVVTARREAELRFGV